MQSLKSLIDDAYIRRRTALIGAALLLTALVPAVTSAVPASALLMLSVTGLVLVAAVVLFALRERPHEEITETTDPNRSARRGTSLLLYLSPVIFLNIVFPLVSPRMAAATVGDVQLTYVVLASSVTVPWLAQAVCMPAYRVIGELMAERDMAKITRRFCQSWPLMFVQSLPLVALFVIPLGLATQWSFEALGAYVVLCAAHVLFVQSLVLANVGERRGLWALAWGAYAVALAVAPTLWLLPPLLGTLTQVVSMRRHLHHLRAFEGFGHRDFGADVIRGLLLGSVLWADKFLLYLMTDGQFQIVVVFMAMLPAVLAYNFYFVNLAPRVDRAVAGLHRAIQHEPLPVLASHSSLLSRVVDRSVLRVGSIGMTLTLGAALLLGGLQPHQALLAVVVAVASWGFMMLTLLSYELDYIGEKATAQAIGAAHLLVCAVAFAGLSTVSAYVVLIVGDLALLAVAWTLYKRHWAQPEYTLFWRHATSW